MKNNDIFKFDISEKCERIIELENNPEFKKLPYHQQVILLTGEKLLQIDQKLRMQTNYLNDFILQYGNAISDIATNQKNIQSFIKNLIKQETLNLTRDLKENGAIPSVDEQKIVDLIEEKYSEEISNMETRLEYATKQTIKNFDETIYDTLEKIDNLTQFEIKAKEELQKNQDRIYLIEEEIARQKEINETLEESFNKRISELSKLDGHFDTNSSIFNYKYYDSRFDTIEELESFIKDESKKIAKEEVEKYIHDYNLFSEDRNDELIEKLFEEGQLKESEVSKVYKLQLENNNKMNDLEYLLDEQNRQIKLLSEDRQNLVQTLSEVLKNKDVDISKILETMPFKNFNDEFIYKERSDSKNAYDINPSNILNSNEMEILVKKQAIELVKEKIALLNKKKIENTNLKEVHDANFEDKELQKYFDQANKKIAALESQLKEQIKENDNLKNDLFDEISKNNLDAQNNEFILKNNDNIINDIDSIDWENLTDEELMKHNYYNGTTPIPGTKITRINNYKINNDFNSSNFSSDAQHLIKQDAEKIANEKESNNFGSAWQESNQKLLDLENLISRQEEEIKRLKTKDTVATSGDKNTLSNIDESIKEALMRLQDLSSAQEKTKKEIEETNRKIHDLESQLRKSKSSDIEEELARKELDKLMEEKYSSKPNYQDINYSDEIKKIEAERRKIEETLELERIRLLSEIEANRKKLEEAPVVTEVPVQQAPIATQLVEEKPKKIETTPQPKEEVKFVLEAPKKKRKQQLFFEIKTHSTPKLTRADLEK